MTAPLRRRGLVRKLVDRYGGTTVGTMILLQDLLTRPGVRWVGEQELIRRRGRLRGVERRRAAQVVAGLAACFDERWISVRIARVHPEQRLVRWIG